jgi:DNA-binding CsgD family transcriptional regulator
MYQNASTQSASVAKPLVWLAYVPQIYVPRELTFLVIARDEESAPVQAPAKLAQLRFQAQINRFAGRLIPHAIDLDAYIAHAIPPVEAGPGEEPRARSSADEVLTARELNVLHATAAGRSNAEIAAELVLSVGTIKWHLANIYSKLVVRRRTQALAVARERGLLR